MTDYRYECLGDWNVPPELNAFLLEQDREKRACEEKTEELKKLTKEELLEEIEKLKTHKDILEKAVLSRQKTIEKLQNEIERLNTKLSNEDFIIPYENFLLMISNIDFSENSVEFYFNDETDKYIFTKSLMNVILKLKKTY